MSNKEVVKSASDSQMTFSNLLHPLKLRQLAADWIAEDVPAFDYGGFVVGEKMETAVLLCKSSGVLAGMFFRYGHFRSVFSINYYFSE